MKIKKGNMILTEEYEDEVLLVHDDLIMLDLM
jgi:hypothetical protein